MQRRSLMVLGVATCATAWNAHAQSTPIRLVVPFAPGGGADTTARIIAPELADALGRSVQVENRPGAGGSSGMAEVARATADGSVLGLATVSTHGVNPAVYLQLPYRAREDFEPVAEMVRAPGVLAVDARLGVDNLDALRARLKQSKPPLAYGSPGNGTVGHMWGELFRSTTNVPLVHKANGPDGVIGALGRGDVALFFDQVAPLLPHLKSGRLRALAVSWPQRLPLLPDVPTYAEHSLFSNNDPSWFGIVAPMGTPQATIRAVHRGIQSALTRPAVVAALAAQGLFPTGAGPYEFGITIQRELDKMRRVNRFAKVSIAA